MSPSLDGALHGYTATFKSIRLLSSRKEAIPTSRNVLDEARYETVMCDYIVVMYQKKLTMLYMLELC